MRSPVGLLRRLLTPRRREVPVGRFSAGRWADVDAVGDVECDQLTLTTYNIWNDALHAEHRYRVIADLLHRRAPDLMVFQEVTPVALDVFLAQPWIRTNYLRAHVTGRGVGDYGMLLLSRVPVNRVMYTRLPTQMDRGFLLAELSINGVMTQVCCVHLDSGKASARLRARQLQCIVDDLRAVENAVMLGDFNMRDAENANIAAPFVDVWPALRPNDPGFTEDTAINLMRFDMKNKPRQVRFDRVLVKGPCWSAAEIELLGTEAISEDLPRVFPSDHFGLQCRLTTRNP